MKKILILGGTRFLGIRFVELFRDRYEITCATRGTAPLPVGTIHLPLDRFDPRSCEEAFKSGSYDCVIDTLCFDAQHASYLVESLGERCGKILMISSRSVYEGSGPFKEGHFNPSSYAITQLPAVHSIAIPPNENQLSYGEGKRDAEAYLSQHSPVPCSFLRFPILIGNGDYTGRLRWHIDRILSGEEIDFGESWRSTSFISVDDAARSLHRLIESDTTGPLNLASPAVTMDEVISVFEKVLGRGVERGETWQSPYRLTRDTSLDCSKALALDLSFTDILTSFIKIIGGETQGL